MKLHNTIFNISSPIGATKSEYNCLQALKLNDPKASSKTYWSILKTFYNGKKIFIIPPLLNNNIVSN